MERRGPKAAKTDSMNNTAVIAFLTAVILSRLVPRAARFGCFESERQPLQPPTHPKLHEPHPGSRNSHLPGGTDLRSGPRPLPVQSARTAESTHGLSGLAVFRATPGNAALAAELQHRLRMTKPTGLVGTASRPSQLFIAGRCR